MNDYKIFDGYVEEYDNWFLENDNVFISELKLLYESLKDIKKDEILSVGCGSGLFEQALKKQYKIEVKNGLEPSEDMAEIARKRGLDVEIGDCENTQLSKEKYDVIYLNGCSTYMKDLKKAYKNCYQALKEGGNLVILDVPVESAYGILYLLADKMDGYDADIFRRIAPKLSYPIELVKSGIWYSALEKEKIVREDLHMKNIKFLQTLTVNPIYTNDQVEEPVEGYNKGGYVAMICQK